MMMHTAAAATSPALFTRPLDGSTHRVPFPRRHQPVGIGSPGEIHDESIVVVVVVVGMTHRADGPRRARQRMRMHSFDRRMHFATVMHHHHHHHHSVESLDDATGTTRVKRHGSIGKILLHLHRARARSRRGRRSGRRRVGGYIDCA